MSCGDVSVTNERSNCFYCCGRFSRTVSLLKPSYRSAGRMLPATGFSVARGSIQEKFSNMKFVEKRVSLQLCH